MLAARAVEHAHAPFHGAGLSVLAVGEEVEFATVESDAWRASKDEPSASTWSCARLATDGCGSGGSEASAQLLEAARSRSALRQ